MPATPASLFPSGSESLVQERRRTGVAARNGGLPVEKALARVDGQLDGGAIDIPPEYQSRTMNQSACNCGFRLPE